MIEKKYRLRMTMLGILFVTVFCTSFFFGRYAVDFGQLIADLYGVFRDGVTNVSSSMDLILLPGFISDGLQQATLSSNNGIVILLIRMPRIIMAALVGAALATAGVSYQGMFRNPMVSPDILGASTGAGFGAALSILLGFGYFGIMATAFAFGLTAVILAYVISQLSRLNPTLALVLGGVMISSLFSAGTSFVKLVADTEDQLPAITYWLMGSLSSIKQSDLPFAVIPIIIGILPLFLFRWRINLLTVGEDEAKSIGLNTGRLRLLVIFCATLMTSASVAVSGMIGWVGLVIPHFCRLIFGYDYRRLIPASALMGAAFLILVDNIARTAMTSEIPLGILTSFVGAPVFIYLILTGGEDRDH